MKGVERQAIEGGRNRELLATEGRSKGGSGGGRGGVLSTERRGNNISSL